MKETFGIGFNFLVGLWAKACGAAATKHMVGYAE
jgi:hypothetical protein